MNLRGHNSEDPDSEIQLPRSDSPVVEALEEEVVEGKPGVRKAGEPLNCRADE